MRKVWGLVGFALLFEGGVLAVAVVLGGLLDASPFWTFRLNGAGIAAGVAATIPLLLGLAWSLKTRWPPIAQLTEQVIVLLRPLLTHGSVAVFVCISLAAGVAEEALFRGVVQVVLIDALGVAGAILTAGALFGLAHAVTPFYAGLAALVGAYLGFTFYFSGNLAVPILAHALYDFVALSRLARLARLRADRALVPGHADGQDRQAGVEAAEVVAHEVDVRGEREALGQPDVVPDADAK